MGEPIVEVLQGKLKGQVRKTPKNKEFYSFKGIPYAKPPVGDLRFAPPSPPEPWDGIKDATKDVNACIQAVPTTDSSVGSEDCLYLNVYTPRLPGEDEESSLLPVMFYVHGGGFVLGQGNDENGNGPEYFMEKYVVMVSINYRLGILGFLSLNCKEAPGNMGLKDQVQALKWVQENIHSFDGDPNNVTIFGLSAGGASIEYLLLSPTAKGLFHKAIAQCGSSLCHWAQNSKIKQLAYKTAALNGQKILKDKDLLQYLKALNAKDLVKLAWQAVLTDNFRGGLHFGFVPTVETKGEWEAFIAKNTYDMLKKGEFTKVPFMAGFAEREGLLVIIMRNHAFKKVVNEKNFVQTLPFELDATEEFEIERRLQDVYLKPENLDKESDAYAIDYFTDVEIVGGVYTATSFIAQHNDKPVYFYEFCYDGNLNVVKHMLNIEREGPCHGDELGYLLKMATLANAAPTLKDIVTRERMVTMWTNFAKYEIYLTF